MQLSDWLFEKIKDAFDLEIELLQGTVEKLPNGLIKIDIQVSDEKIRMFQDLINHLMQIPTNQIKVSVLGQQVNPN